LEFFDFRLFQQYRHLADMFGLANDIGSWHSAGPLSV
jgi:hypothetical protein